MKIVISGVNLVEGGTLKIFRDALSELDSRSDEGLDVVALVNNKKLFSDLSLEKIKFLEFNDVKKSWSRRIFFEYFTLKKISKELKPDVWLSIHDMTPNVFAKKQYVYCHNCSPAYKVTLKDLYYDVRFFLFSLLYNYLYRINIRKNNAIIVQQKWFGEYLKKNAGALSYIVSRPVALSGFKMPSLNLDKDNLTFFYPALPRTFKNFEVILEAISIVQLNKTSKDLNLIFNFTFDKNDNAFAKHLIKKYNHLDNVNFVGRLSFNDVLNYYAKSDIVIFTSKLETWGLPISEAKKMGKPLILSDLPYAHETLGDYPMAKFVNPNDPKELALLFEKLMHKENIFYAIKNVSFGDEVKSLDWQQTFDFILNAD